MNVELSNRIYPIYRKRALNIKPYFQIFYDTIFRLQTFLQQQHSVVTCCVSGLPHPCGFSPAMDRHTVTLPEATFA